MRLPTSLSAELSRDRWQASSAERRRELALAVGAQLGAQGCELSASSIVSFGPSDEEPGAVWTWRGSTLRFALVPGGAFAPGLGDVAQAEYLELTRRHRVGATFLEAWGKPLDQWPATGLARVGPLLVATTPFLRSHTELLTESLTAGTLRLFDGIGPEGDARGRHPLCVTRLEAECVAKRFGFDVPTTEELEWAMGGGSPHLFYFLDDEPDHDLDMRELAAELRSVWADDEPLGVFDCSFGADDGWPRVNRFGLEGTLAVAQWCKPAARSTDATTPWRSRGGAGQTFPWQGPEWPRLMTAYDQVEDAPYTTCALRPVIRLDG